MVLLSLSAFSSHRLSADRLSLACLTSLDSYRLCTLRIPGQVIGPTRRPCGAGECSFANDHASRCGRWTEGRAPLPPVGILWDTNTRRIFVVQIFEGLLPGLPSIHLKVKVCFEAVATRAVAMGEVRIGPHKSHEITLGPRHQSRFRLQGQLLGTTRS